MNNSLLKKLDVFLMKQHLHFIGEKKLDVTLKDIANMKRYTRAIITTQWLHTTLFID